MYGLFFVSLCSTNCLFFLSCRNLHDMNEWIEAVNLVAATYSAPPLPAPVGSWYNKLSYTFCNETFNNFILDCLAIIANSKGSIIRAFDSWIVSCSFHELTPNREKHPFLGEASNSICYKSVSAQQFKCISNLILSCVSFLAKSFSVQFFHFPALSCHL